MRGCGWKRGWSAALAVVGLAGCEVPARMDNANKVAARPVRTRATPAPRAEGTSTADEPQNAATAAMEEDVLTRINQIRQEQHLRPLRVNRSLTHLARAFSRKMAVEKFFSHESPSGETFEERIRRARLDFARIGENIYKGYNLPKPAESAVKAWMSSPGHRHNILTAEYTETGIGVWKAGKTLYFTQDFIRPR